ncbi:hypothetical protein JI739_13875 [Ramlibacter sp. AW1]|uniref:Uncharacterized protein n=1 Tax=Ramlibacter aurantiacus TaxID=2801330 RepID=A0A936ZPM8_9BURK|nr:hypothetical protein [Ramlibacter aurantiacus]MBL0421441.1 hypothetical protein [Ramlibacter aurantiacus]
MLDHGLDQAAGLRRLRGAAPSLLAFPVGEKDDDAWIAQLAGGLRQLGRRPLLVDASRGRVSGALGLRVRHDLLDLLQGRRSFTAVARSTREGIPVVRADRALEAFAATGARPRELFAALLNLGDGFDALLLAMPARELACLASPAQVVPVVSPEASEAGLTEAYATIKQLACDFGYQRFAAVMRETSAAAAAQLHGRLADVARSFLRAEVRWAGCVPAPGAGAAALGDLARRLLDHAATPVTLH